MADAVIVGGRLGVGNSVARPDAVSKVDGSFEFSNDLHHENMLWGATLRSPHPHARIVSIDVGPALAIAGVSAVLTHEDVPGKPTYGLIVHDQPVFAADVVRYVGEPVAGVAADHPETARRAVAAIDVQYEVLDPVVDLLAAEEAAPIHPDGNLVRHVPIRCGDVDAVGDVVVEGTYEMGMQDQAFMGPESGLAIPAGDGSVDLYLATQWLHEDRDQVAACLGLPDDMVRLHLAGTGGAFGAREDVSFHVHASLLALHTGRPVKMQYRRDESFLGHVHRHPAHMRYRHHATNDGRLVKVECEITLDGGAYASSSFAVVANAARFSPGPYKVPNAVVDARVVRTNNPPCGAMRGFGAVQVCYGHESQMDKLAAALDMDPVEIRLLNAMETGDRMITGQVIDCPAPVRECIEAAAGFDLPGPADETDPFQLPGGAGRTADPLAVRRGVGFAVGFKNAAFAEGFVDDTHARCRLEDGQVTLWCAAAEVGQGFVTISRQIAASVLGTDDVDLVRASTTDIGSAGSSSASRQTYMSGRAVMLACEEVAEQVRIAAATKAGLAPETVDIVDGRLRSLDGTLDTPVASAVAGERFEVELRHMHRDTFPLDLETGQGDCDVAWIFAAHRAVVDVDTELGLIDVVEVTTGQDVGTVLNPVSVIGQIEGGISQGVGLAVMEEIVTDGGLVKNPSFTDYLIPTMVDMPNVKIALITEPDEGGPFGAKGVGETPSLSSTPAVAAAVRAATGLELSRVPIKPDDIALA